MSFESICCSLETAKKLKELGWDKPTAFVWADSQWVNCSIEPKRYVEVFCEQEDDLNYNYYPAPTCSEVNLGECEVAFIKNRVYVSCNTGLSDFAGRTTRVETSESESEARCKMWIYLKENNLI